ncbi:replication protein, partial [uncultured marine virus]
MVGTATNAVPMPQNQRSREYVWTLPNYTPGDIAKIAEFSAEYCTYNCFQPELAPTTGTPHLQGYLCLTTPRTLQGVKQTVFNTPSLQRVHLEIARGSKDQCRDYCCKDETRDPDAGFGFIEHGGFETSLRAAVRELETTSMPQPPSSRTEEPCTKSRRLTPT